MSTETPAVSFHWAEPTRCEIKVRKDKLLEVVSKLFQSNQKLTIHASANEYDEDTRFPYTFHLTICTASITEQQNVDRVLRRDLQAETKSPPPSI